MFPRLGSLRKEDAQDDDNIETRKQPRLPKCRGKIVACFICYQNHFAIDCTSKKKLGDLEEDQVQPTIKKKLATFSSGNPSAIAFKGNVGRSRQVYGRKAWTWVTR